MIASTAREEWATMWPLPLVCMVGVSGSAMFAYAGGVYMESVTTEFGWTRAQYSSAFLLMMISGLVMAPTIGWLADRWGPRVVALTGIVPFGLSISAFGLIEGKLWQWYALCVLLAATQAAISQIVWIKAIVGRFHHSRGMAMAISLAGVGLGSFIWPVLAAICIDVVGWRGTFPIMAAIYVAVALPLAFLFFQDPPPAPGERVKRTNGHALSASIKSRTFIGLAVAAGLFAAASYGMSMHFVPILKSGGMNIKTAAGIAGLIGIFSIAGRLITGLLLDRMPTRLVGVMAFLLPLGAVASLIAFPRTLAVAVVAAAFMGFASGAELDIVTYIVARRFGQEVFGAIYAVFTAIIAVSASVGPVIAGAIFDASHSYSAWLWILAAMVVTGAAIVASIPLSADDDEQSSEPTSIRA